MKKYIGTLFAILVMGLLITPNLSFAQVGDIDPNPASDCVALQNNLRYRDRDMNKNGEVSTLQDFLQSEDYLNSEPTGYFGILTVRAVKEFQKDNNINPTGYVGPVTKAKIKALTCDELVGGDKDKYGCIGSAGYTWCQEKNKCLRTWEEKCEINSRNNPVISGISGPQTLNVGQQGTWKVSASSPNGGNLSYNVLWGDESYKIATPSSLYPIQQEATFTHTYTLAGIYKPIFTVTSENTIRCITTQCPGNSGSAQTSLSVRVGSGTTKPSITVSSPKSGDVWTTGQTYKIHWSPNPSMSILPSNVRITLDFPRPACLDANPTCMILQIAPYVIAENVPDTGSYKWTVPTDLPEYYRGAMQITVTRDRPESTGKSGLFTILKPGCISIGGYNTITGHPCSL